MKTNILTLIIVASVIFFTSCEKEIEFKGEQTDPKLVINSLIEPSQPVSAAISKSYFFLDNTANTIAPDDLVATLYVNGNRIGEMTPHYDTIVSYNIWDPNNPNLGRIRKIYTHDYCPAKGDIIKITASAQSFEDVEGETSQLPDTLDCQMDVTVTNWSGGYIHVYNPETQEFEETDLYSIGGHLDMTITIIDPNPGKTDYFRLSTSKNDQVSMGENRCYISFEYDDPIFGSGIVENEFIDASDLDTRPKGVFTDMLFDGGSYRLKLKVHFSCNLDEDYDPEFFHVPFMIEHLSKEYYNYLFTCNQGDETMQIWAEPIQTYSNVKGGYGIVGGRSVNTLWYALPLEEQ